MYTGFKVFMSKKYFILPLFHLLDFEKIFCEITNRILSTEMGIFYGASYWVILGEAADMLSLFLLLLLEGEPGTLAYIRF